MNDEKEFPGFRKPVEKLTLTYQQFMELDSKERGELLRQAGYEWKTLGRPRILVETEWTHELEHAVASGHTVCPVCNGCGQVHVTQRSEYNGAWRSFYPSCHCKVLRGIWKLASNAIPARYSFANIWTLKPHESNHLSMAQQQSELDFIRDHMDDGFFLAGEPGTGKTTVAYALLRRAYERNIPIFGDTYMNPWGKSLWLWRVNFDTLMRQYQEQATQNDAPEPDVTVSRIEAASKKGRRPTLVIEEIDKGRQTEFRANKLFALVDALYNANGQLIITTNLSLAGFDAMFSKGDNESVRVAGDALMRRILEMTHIRDYFSQR